MAVKNVFLVITLNFYAAKIRIISEKTKEQAIYFPKILHHCHFLLIFAPNLIFKMDFHEQENNHSDTCCQHGGFSKLSSDRGAK
jgi:hypothetical protein